jgi:hypothetical protein
MRILPLSLSGAVVGVCVAALAANGDRQGAAAAPEEGWSGAATITRQGTGPIGAGQVFHSERMQLTLRPDGTASYVAHYEWRMTLPMYPPLRSSGTTSGETYWGLGYVDLLGGAWEVGAAGAQVRARLDTTSMSQAFYDMLVAPFSGNRSVPPVIEDEWRTVEGFVDIARQPSTARSLSGTITGTVPLGAMQNLAPLTESISWTVTKATADRDPRVAIYGPACGCIDAEDPGRTTLRFTAGATRRGGEFSEFVVTAEGEAPEVLENSGGAQPVLELKGKETTGPVTLRIRYTRDGRTFDAAPFRVEFCAMKPIELDDPSADAAFSGDTGRAEIAARQEAWLNGRAANDQVAWTLDKIPAPTVQTVVPTTAQGERVTFTYAGLPRRHDEFGPRTLEARVQSGACNCSRTQPVRLFFNADATNNPEGTDPNWYYYWKQTDAVPATARSVTMVFRGFLPLDPGAPGGTVAARWDGVTETLFIGSEASQLCELPRQPAPPHDPSGRAIAEGIDCFAELVAHELQHRTDFITWWGSPKGPHSVTRLEWLARDFDLDLVPNGVEDTLPGCRSGAPTRENKYSCDARPLGHVPDAEVNAYYTGWAWPLGQVNHQDWSCGGASPKQWKGRTCR